MPDQNNNPNPSPTSFPPYAAADTSNPEVTAPPGDQTYATASTGTDTPPVVAEINSANTSGGNGNVRRMIAPIAGIAVLLIALGAGVFLIGQQQQYKSGATDAQCFAVVGDPSANQCTFDQNPTHCWRATTNNQCRRLSDGQIDNTLEVFSGLGTFDGQVCYTCDANSLDNGQRKCSAGTLIEQNANCSTGGGGGGGGSTEQPSSTPASTPTLSACGGSCSNDADCAGSTTYNVGVGCRGGKCVNLECEAAGGTTENGSLCRCFGITHNSCGDPCGAAIGLCGPGLTCTYLAKNQCSSSTRWPVCVPEVGGGQTRGDITSVPQYQGAYFQRIRCGAGTGDPNNEYIYHPAFASGMTIDQVLQYVCNAGTPQTTATCTDVKIYDTSWNELTSAQIAALKPGNTIRIAIAGTTSTGSIDQARFTVNGTQRAAVSQKRPNSTDFYDEVTIPTGATTLSIKGELHHATLGWF